VEKGPAESLLIAFLTDDDCGADAAHQAKSGDPGRKDGKCVHGRDYAAHSRGACWVRRKRTRAGRSHVDGSVTSVGECAIIHKRTDGDSAKVGEGAKIVKAIRGDGAKVGEGASIAQAG